MTIPYIFGLDLDSTFFRSQQIKENLFLLSYFDFKQIQARKIFKEEHLNKQKNEKERRSQKQRMKRERQRRRREARDRQRFSVCVYVCLRKRVIECV